MAAMAAAAAFSAASVASAAICWQLLRPLRGASRSRRRSPRVRGVVEVAHREHLGVDRAVGRAVGDGAEHRPRHAALLARVRDRRGLHVERDHPALVQRGEIVELGDELVVGPHVAGVFGVTEPGGTVLAPAGSVDDDLGEHDGADGRVTHPGARDPDDEHVVDVVACRAAVPPPRPPGGCPCR